MKRFRNVFLICLFLTPGVSYRLAAQWKMADGPYNNTIQTIAAPPLSAGGSPSSVFYAGTWGDGLFRYTYDGTRWSASCVGLVNKNIYSIAFSRDAAGDTLCIVGTWGDGLFLSTDKGVTWTNSGAGMLDPLIASLAVSGQNIYAGTDNGVFLSTDNGLTWSGPGTGFPSVIVLSLLPGAPGSGTLFAGTAGSGLFLSTDGGGSWNAADSGLTATYISALGSLPDTGAGAVLFAGTDNGAFLSTDNGATWAPSGLSSYQVSAFVADGPTMYAATLGLGVFASTDRGATWNDANSGLNDATDYTMAISPSAAGGNLLVTGTDEGAYVTPLTGISWVQLISPVFWNDFNAITPGGDAQGSIFAGADEGLYRSTDQGGSWDLTLDGVPQTGVFGLTAVPTGSGGSNIFAATSGDQVILSTDQGTSWNMVSSGLPPSVVSSILGLGDGSGSSILYAGMSSQGIYLSTDNGASWNVSLPWQHISAISSMGAYIYCATSAGIYRSSDGGTHWSLSGLQGNTVFSFAQGANGWIFAGLDDGVYYSSDNGATWQPSGFTGENAYALACYGGTLFAAMDDGVFYSTDNGSTWIDSGLYTNTVDAFAVIPGGSAVNLFAGTPGSGIYEYPLVPGSAQSITVSSGDHGAISPAGTATVSFGGTQTFFLRPDAGYRIDTVIVDDRPVGTAPFYTFADVAAPHTIRAVFTNHFYITASASANGSITPSGVIPVMSGDSVTFTIRPDAGFHIDSLLVDDVFTGTDSTYTFPAVAANHTIRAVFHGPDYTILATAGAGGTISPSGSVGVFYRFDQTFSIHPNTGYLTDSIIVDGAPVDIDTTYTFDNVRSNHTIRAVFRIIQYPIVATAGPNGTISPSGTVMVAYGSNQRFSIRPNSGFKIDSVVVDGLFTGFDTSYTFTSVTAGHTIRAVFSDFPIITASAGPNGTIAPSGRFKVPYGSAQSFSIHPSTGYYIDSILVDGAFAGTDTAYTFTNVVIDHSIRAVFHIIRFLISSETGANGVILPLGDLHVDYGSNQAYVLRPNAGYHVDSIIVDGAYAGHDTTYTFTNIRANHTIRSVFRITLDSITAQSGPNGVIVPSGTVTLTYGDSLRCAMRPATGYHVDSVIVDGAFTGTDTVYVFRNVSANHTIRVVFRINQYTITASAGANGTITPSGAVQVNYGSSQTFSIRPATGYHVDSLIVDGAARTADTTFTFSSVNASHTIRAVFRITQYTINASAKTHGTITPSGNVIVYAGNNQTFTITSDSGYHVDSIVVDGAFGGTGSTYTFFNVQANHTIRIVYHINQYTITATAGANGTIVPSGAVIVNYLAGQSFTMHPNASYHIDSVIVDGLFAGIDSVYSFTAVTANHTIRAVFGGSSYTITAGAGPNGTITPSGSVAVGYLSSQRFVFSPSAEYHLDSLIVDGVRNTDSTTGYTFTAVSANHSIRVTFVPLHDTIVAGADLNGSISPSGTLVYTYGSSQRFTFAPHTGYQFHSLIVDGIRYLDSTAGYTFTGITANHVIYVSFVQIQLTITATSGANGSITPPGSIAVSYGGGQMFTFGPATGYHLDSLIVDGIRNTDSTTEYTFANVTTNHTIRTTYAVNLFSITATSGSNGTINPSGVTQAGYGSSLRLTFSPSTGYHLDSLIVDGIRNTDSTTGYTFSNITTNHTIRTTYAINQYTITATSGPNGTISPSGISQVSYGSSLRVTFSPSTGYHLDSLIVDGVRNTDSTTGYTFTNVTANHTIRITYAINQYTITATSGPNGTISPSGITQVSLGSSLRVTFSPSTGYHLDSLIVDGVQNTDSATGYTFTNVTANHTIRTTYAVNLFTITATSGSNGTISPSGITQIGYGSSLRVTFSPSTGYHLDSLIVDGVQNTDSATGYTFANVTTNHTIRTTYAVNQFTITATSGPNGTISPSGISQVNYGSSLRVTFSPSTGYHLDSLLVDGIRNTDSIAGYTFTNVSTNHTIRTTYAVNQFTIMATSGPNGAITPSGSIGVNYGGGQRFTFSPSNGYHLDSLIVDGIRNVDSTAGYTFTNVTANHTIRTTYAVNQFTITATSGPNGAITPSGSIGVNYGGGQRFTFSPSNGYHLDSLIVDGIRNVDSTAGYTFTNVTTNHTIRTTYRINQFTITATSGANGTINPSGAIAVNYGSALRLTFTPGTGYHLDSLIVDGVQNTDSAAGYTFSGIASNHTIRVVYTIIRCAITASAGPHGSVIPSGTIMVNYGSGQSFTMRPDPGCHIDSVIVDGAMAGTDSVYAFSGVTVDHTLRAVFSLTIALDLGITDGWNLVSVPVTMPQYLKASVFPTAISSAFFYQGAYQTADPLAPGIGYWVRFSGKQTVHMTGGNILAETLNVQAGWNMIGSVSGAITPLQVISIPGGITLSPFFGYQTGYAVSDSIRPGKGYWVKADRAAMLVFAQNSGIAGRIRIVATSEKPPRPPEGNEDPAAIPAVYALAQNYPNPFNPSTVVNYDLPASGEVRLVVYDILGREVAVVVNQFQQAGRKSVVVDCSQLGSGVYFYRLQAGSFSATRKFTVLR